MSLECFLDYLAETEHIDAERSTSNFERQHLKAWLAWMIEQRHYTPQHRQVAAQRHQAFLAYAARRPHAGRAQPGSQDLESTTAARERRSSTWPNRNTGGHPTTSPGTRAKVRQEPDAAPHALRPPASARSPPQGWPRPTWPRPATSPSPPARRDPPPCLTCKTIKHLRVYLDEFHPTLAHCPRPGRHLPRAADGTVGQRRSPAQCSTSCRGLPAPACPFDPGEHPLPPAARRARPWSTSALPCPIIMHLLGHRQLLRQPRRSTPGQAVDMINRRSTPPLRPSPPRRTAPDRRHTLQALYSLRWTESLSRGIWQKNRPAPTNPNADSSA